MQVLLDTISNIQSVKRSMVSGHVFAAFRVPEDKTSCIVLNIQRDGESKFGGRQKEESYSGQDLQR